MVHSCPVCNGTGGTVFILNKRFVIDPPLLHTRHSASNESFKRTLTTGLAAFFFVLMVAGLVAWVITQEKYAAVIFSLGSYASLFWAGGHLANIRPPHLSLQALGSTDKPASFIRYCDDRVITILEGAAQQALSENSAEITPFHMLEALLEDSRIQNVLLRGECDLNAFTQYIASLKTKAEAPVQVTHFSSASKEVLANSLAIALENELPHVDGEDILLAIVNYYPELAQLVKQFSITPEQLYDLARWMGWEDAQRDWWVQWGKGGRGKPKGKMNKAWSALPTPTLDHFGNDLTSHIPRENLALLKARDKELLETLGILGRSGRNSMLIRSEDALGSRAIISAIALRMLEENVPEPLLDKRLVEVDIAALLTSSAHPEQLLQSLLVEISNAGNVVLVLPSIQLLAPSSKQSLDASAVLVSAITQGNIQVLSTCNHGDYRRYIEGNPNLKDALSVVTLAELTPAEALPVLELEVPRLESKYNVGITYPALMRAVTLASRLISDPPLPRSALDLLEELASAQSQKGGGVIDQSSIDALVQQKTGVPVGMVDGQEKDRLLHIEEELSNRVIGQSLATHLVAQAIQRSRAGLHQSNRPVSSFLFVGPTGVGKTETAKALAAIYFGSEERMVRIDMSEYQEPQSVYRLIGAPAQSSDALTEGGMLTTPIREHPFSLILLDEFEKAHPDVLNLFLQLLDDGRLTDNAGRTVKYSNTIVIATSNAGVKEMVELSLRGLSPEEFEKESMAVLKNYYKPELINRFDAVIPFSALRREEVLTITQNQLKHLINSTRDQGYEISFSEDAVQYIADRGYNPEFGARPIRRAVQDIAESRVASLLLSDQLPKDRPLEITADMLR